MKPHRQFQALGALFAALLLGACGGSKNPAGPGAPTPAAPTIGAEGGNVAGGAANLSVPANALAGPVALNIRNTVAVPLDPYAVVGASVEVGPAGTTFATPARLTLSYAGGQPPLGIDAGELRLHVLEGSEWRLLPSGSADSGMRTVSAPLSRTGIFGARWVVGRSAACSGAETRQFDFWLGHWNLVVPNGVAGTNDIVRNGCVLEEEFHEVSGTLGRSVSFLGSADHQWYQTYVDSRGGRVPLGGVLEGRDMVLYVQGGGGRSTWQPQSRDRVRFFQESQTGGAFRITFDSTYVRR
jgi:hypothetical protein